MVRLLDRPGTSMAAMPAWVPSSEAADSGASPVIVIRSQPEGPAGTRSDCGLPGDPHRVRHLAGGGADRDPGDRGADLGTVGEGHADGRVIALAELDRRVESRLDPLAERPVSGARLPHRVRVPIERGVREQPARPLAGGRLEIRRGRGRGHVREAGVLRDGQVRVPAWLGEVGGGQEGIRRLGSGERRRVVRAELAEVDGATAQRVGHDRPGGGSPGPSLLRSTGLVPSRPSLARVIRDSGAPVTRSVPAAGWTTAAACAPPTW